MKGKEIKLILSALLVVGIMGHSETVKGLERVEVQDKNNVIQLDVENENSEYISEVIEESIKDEDVVKKEFNDIQKEEKSKETELKSGWKLENGKYYFYNKDGSKKTGFYTDPSGDTYYLDENTGAMKTGWVKIKGLFYSFKNNGVMRKGWYNDGYDWYMLDKATGIMKTGWYKDGPNWYMLDKSTGVMKTGWYNDGYDWYMLNNNGTMKTGFYNDKYGDTYYLNPTTGVMEKGWALDQNNNYHYYKDNGVMVKGWFTEDGVKYYLKENNNGIMATGIVEIDCKNYRFQDNGALIVDRWYEGGTTYSDLNGEFKVIDPSDAGSGIQYNMVWYMGSLANRESVHNKAIALHNGMLENNCVYFTAELLRRVGISIPNYIANTVQLEKQLLNRGWKKHTNLNNLKPGDIVFAGYTHSFTFMGWAGDGYAYVVDNQKSTFGSVLHKRKIFEKDSKYDTNKSTHFFRL